MTTKYNERDLTQAEVKRLFRYDDETGDLIWLERPRSDFKNKQATASWNTRYAGNMAGYLRKDGYRLIRTSGKLYLAHRLIWIVHNGPIPEGMFIDHVNEIKDDCRIENLRLATKAENSRNRGSQRNSTTGIKGVYSHQDKYKACIGVDGKSIYLGVGTLEECARLYAEAANQYHQDFARIV